MTQPDPLLRVEPRVILTELKDGTGLLLHLGTKFYFTLNASGVFVWKTLAALPRTRVGLMDAMLERYDASTTDVQRDLEALLDEMIGEELVRLG